MVSSSELNADERAELNRLRAQAAHRGGWARAGRWTAALALMVVAAFTGVLAVVAVYLKSEVLNTDAYVQTVAPLADDLAVRSALADRITLEIVTRADLETVANDLADRLIAQGAPQRVEDLVGPAVNGVTSFLRNEIYKLLGTPQFQQIWEQVNRVAHTAVVTVLTGREGQFVSSSGDTVTVDLGALLSAAKQRLAEAGLGFVNRIPDVSIPYELVTSDQLPKMRTYTKILNTLGTWLPYVTLALLAGGMLTAPNRRRGLLIGVVLLGFASALALGFLSLTRSYYLDNLPSAVQSPDAAAAVIDTMLSYLIASLKTLLTACAVGLVALLLAGPSRPAVALRRLVNRGLDATARGLSHAGSWVAAVGRTLAGARGVIMAVLVIAGVVGLIVADRPSIAAVLWTSLAVVAACAIVEMFVRGARASSSLPFRPAG